MNIYGIPSALGCIAESKGVADAPVSIMDKLHRIFHESTQQQPRYEEVKINKSNLQETFAIIENLANKCKDKTIFIGGDHSITYPLVKGIVKGISSSVSGNNSSIALVVFDAHPDSVNDFSPPTQEDFLKVLVSEGILNSNQIFLVGLRSIFHSERSFLNQNKIKTYPMETIFDIGIQEVIDILTEQLQQFKILYVSLDIDVLDPAFAPGVDYPEPGGMSSKELIYAIKRLASLKQFKYLDLVEVNPKKDNGQTSLVAAKLLSLIV